MRGKAQQLLNRFGFRLHRIDDLTRFLNEAGSDKGLGLLGRHYYSRVYSKVFSEIRHKQLNFVEIGLLRPDRDGRRSTAGAEGESNAVAHCAPSLVAWNKWFPNASIVGFDIDDFSAASTASITIIQGDMSSPEDLSLIIAQCEGGIDIVIDDGSHVSHHQQIAFSVLFPHLRANGLYCIEDCHWQDPSLERADAVKTRDLLRLFRYSGEIVSPFISFESSKLLEAMIGDVVFYDSIEAGIDDTEDALCIIRRKGY